MSTFSRYALMGICIVLTSMPSFVLGQKFRNEQPPEVDIQNSFDRSTYLDGITSLGQPSAAGLADLVFRCCGGAAAQLNCQAVSIWSNLDAAVSDGDITGHPLDWVQH